MSQTTIAPFFTRWVTHFCAPVFSLPVFYLARACVVLAVYPLCRWFAALKQRRSDMWLSYL